MIAHKSGHKSITGLRFYEKTSTLLEQIAGEVVSGTNITIVKDKCGLKLWKEARSYKSCSYILWNFK